MNFSDTNWLEALYFDSEDREKQARCGTVEGFMRKHGGQVGISHLVYVEARNVFLVMPKRRSQFRPSQ